MKESREKIIDQVVSLWHMYKFGYPEQKNRIVWFEAALGMNCVLTYGVKFIHEFEADIMLICRGGGGEAMCYVIETDDVREEIEEGFNLFDKTWDISYDFKED